jgi:hypothetical protein
MKRPYFNPTKHYTDWIDLFIPYWCLEGTTMEAVDYLRMAMLSPWHRMTVTFQ